MKITNTKRWLSLSFATIALTLSGCEGGEGSSSSVDGGTGIAGSTARMIIVNDYLYAISEENIQLFDISTPSSPIPWAKVTVDWDIQTLFSYENYLLVGAASGVHIMDNSDPASPYKVGDFRHATAIDPVVAKDGYAYVTLKNDPDAFNSIADQMNVISLADATNPELKKVVAMQSPEGLSVVDSSLYVCDGIAGLKHFDISEPENPQFINSLSDVDCNDVIAHEGVLYVITDQSMQQYDYSVSPPALLSTIETIDMSTDALKDFIGS